MVVVVACLNILSVERSLICDCYICRRWKHMMRTDSRRLVQILIASPHWMPGRQACLSRYVMCHVDTCTIHVAFFIVLFERGGGVLSVIYIRPMSLHGN